MTSEEYLETFEHIIKGKRLGVFEWKKVAFPTAAVVALIATIAALFHHFNFPEPIPPKEKRVLVKKENPRGQKSTSILSDGTRVHLNAESELIIDSLYGVSERKVHLAGEAYFEVAEDQSKPFIIQTGELKTTVLGTSFNIRSYDNEKETKIVVASGKVMVAHTSGSSFQLKPNELLRYEKTNGQIQTEKVDNLNSYLGWKDGILTFENNTFDEVKGKIQRWYDITIQVDLALKAQGLYSASYDNKSLIKVLDGWSYASGFSYKKSKDNIIIITSKP